LVESYLTACKLLPSLKSREQRSISDVPTIYHRSRFEMVGTALSRLCPSTHCELICFARKRDFMQRPATNWHDGQITKNLSSPSRKNIPLNFQSKSSA
jgi:hypothetical protein